MENVHEIYGMTAEFASPDDLLAAAQKVHSAGYQRVDAYSPFPVHGVAEALGFPRTNIPLITLIGGVVGACFGFFMCWFANVISYPWNVGGRPPNSWEAFIPITFEMGVLGASLFSVFAMLALNGLPMPYHPVFNVPEFNRASTDRFFVLIESTDPNFDLERTRQFLQGLGAMSVTEVPK